MNVAQVIAESASGGFSFGDFLLIIGIPIVIGVLTGLIAALLDSW